MQHNRDLDYYGLSDFLVKLDAHAASCTDFFSTELLTLLSEFFKSKVVSLFVFDDENQTTMQKVYVYTPDDVLSAALKQNYMMNHHEKDPLFKKICDMTKKGGNTDAFTIINSADMLTPQKQKTYQTMLDSLGLGRHCLTVLINQYRFSFYKGRYEPDYTALDIQKLSYISEIISYKFHHWKDITAQTTDAVFFTEPQRRQCYYKGREHYPLLTNREYEIMVTLSRGMTYEKIAEELNISIHTVNNHLKNIYKKINVKNQREAISWFLE